MILRIELGAAWLAYAVPARKVFLVGALILILIHAAEVLFLHSGFVEGLPAVEGRF